MPPDLKGAVRGLLLPVSPTAEEQYIKFVSSKLTFLGVADGDKASWIMVQLSLWRTTGSPSPELAALVGAALFSKNRNPKTFLFENLNGSSGATYEAAAKTLGLRYFDIHDTLTKQHLLAHDAARQLMSHIGMIVRLRVEENMTASEISRIISIRDGRFDLNWPTINFMLSQLRCAARLRPAQVEEIYDQDAKTEAALFGDLDLEGSISRIGAIAIELGCPGDFERWLLELLIIDFHPPFLVIAHYQLSIQDQFDHALSYGYEFKPRGQSIPLAAKYIGAGISVQRDPFLNNAKATLRFDKAWASGRSDNLRSAFALANILVQLENLGVLAKRELAGQIRGLLHRYIRIEDQKNKGVLPELLTELNAAEAAKLLRGVAKSNSGTTGIIEQRIVDCFGVLENPKANGWAAKGVGDSVFTPNTYRKKFGDCEFEIPNRASPKINAYEAHGGTLTRAYVADHMVSFEKVLKNRREDMEIIGSLGSWSLAVTFIAHKFGDGLPSAFNLTIDGIAVVVGLKYITFKELGDALVGEPQSVDLLNEYFVKPLNEKFVHPTARAKAKELMNA